MARIPRNYIAELSELGVSHSKVADLLDVPVRLVHHWATGRFNPPKALYEPIRNIVRRTTYKYMRKAGYSSYRATGFRRLQHPEAAADIAWLNNVIDVLYNDWNSTYRAYIADPARWIANHPNNKIPTETSREEVQRRIEKGLRRGKSKEEIENY